MQGRLVHEVHRVIEKEGLVLVASDEVDAEGLDDVGIIGIRRRLDGLAVLEIGVLPVPAAGGGIGAVLVESPVAWRLADLPPFARFAGRRSRVASALSRWTTRPRTWRRGRHRARSCYSARPCERRSGRSSAGSARGRRAARRSKSRSASRGGELVDLRRGMPVGAVTAHAIDPQIVREDEDDVGLRRRLGSAKRGSSEGE